MEPIKCACEGMFLDKFIQPSILIELYSEELNGVEILKRLNDGVMSKYGQADPAGFYRTLKKMDNLGTISSRWEIGERPMKLYSITDHGKNCLRAWKRTFEQYSSDLLELSKQIGAHIE